MSRTLRTGIVFGVTAAIAFVAGLIFPLPFINFVLAFGSMIALGVGAGYTAAKTAPPGTGQGLGRGATAGAIAGVVVLVISMIIFALLANVTPVRQAIADVMQQGNVVDPNTADPTSVDPTAAILATSSGAGFCLGMVNLILLVIGGAIGGVLWRGVPSETNTQRTT